MTKNRRKAAFDPKWYAGKNLLINGDFGVWQRGESLTSGEFGPDRWLVSGLGSVLTYAAKVNLVNPLHSTTGVGLAFVKSTADINFIHQRIEFPRRLSGRTVTVSFITYSNTDYEMTGTCYLDSYNPTDGAKANICEVNGFVWNDSGELDGFTRHKFTFTLPELGSNFDDDSSYVSLVISATGITTGAYVSDAKLELGDKATPFIPDDPATNLAKCQRYYEVVSSRVKHDMSTGGTAVTAGYTAYYSARKRIAPSISITTESSDDCAGISGTASYVNGAYFSWQWTGSSGVLSRSKNWIFTADAEL